MIVDRRLRGDLSLNLRALANGEAGDALDRLVDPSPAHEIALAEEEELGRRREALRAAIESSVPVKGIYSRRAF